MKNRVKVIVKSADTGLLDIIRPVVEDEGYTCKQVFQCKDLLSKLSGDDIGLGIVDLDDGETDCVAELKGIRQSHSDLPLIIIFSDESIEQRRKIYELNVFYCLSKPVNKTELSQVISAGMGEKSGVPWRFKTKIRDMKWYSGNIPCMDVCPVHTDSGRYVQLIAEGNFKEAYLVARSPNPLASTCGKICAAFCEDSCRRAKIDCAVTIRALKRYVTSQYGPESENPLTYRELLTRDDGGSQHPWNIPSLCKTNIGGGRRVAVVGGGPAGLACAHDLAIMGFKVTIFEASDGCGGAMQLCIPEYRLPRDILKKEIDAIIGMGIEVRSNTPLSDTYGIQALREEGFEAIFLATGALRGIDLRIPGADLHGVSNAIDFLLNIKKRDELSLGKKVIIIGGGKVALDIARTTWRLITDEALREEPDWEVMDVAKAALQAGVKPIIVYPESVDEMAAAQTIQGKEEISEIKREGIEMLDHRLPKRFIGKDGRVTGVVFDRVSKCIADDGRFAPQIIPDSEETYEADSVIIAVGQKPDIAYFKEADGLEITPQGFIKVDPYTMASTSPGIFAGGDAAFGSRSVIEAVNNGKVAALSIAEYLIGFSLETETHIKFEEIPAGVYHVEAGYEKLERVPPLTIPLEQRIESEEVELDFSPEQALEQAKRCLRCHIETIYDSSKCILCGRCVDICPYGCLRLVPFDEIDVENYDKEMLAGRLGYGPDEDLSVMIKDDEKCIRCGLCALRCPTGAMTMEKFSFVERYREEAVGFE